MFASKAFAIVGAACNVENSPVLSKLPTADKRLPPILWPPPDIELVSVTVFVPLELPRPRPRSAPPPLPPIPEPLIFPAIFAVRRSVSLRVLFKDLKAEFRSATSSVLRLNEPPEPPMPIEEPTSPATFNSYVLLVESNFYVL